MATAFQCPSCSRQLIYETGDQPFQVCRFCGGKIIVPSTVIHENEAAKPGGTGPSLEAQKNLRLAEIQSELNAGRKIDAIKLFRDGFGSDLSTAKRAVEMLETGRRIPGEALRTVAPDRPVEQKIHSNKPVNEPGSVKSAPVIFWIILSIGIAIAAFLLGGD